MKKYPTYEFAGWIFDTATGRLISPEQKIVSLTKGEYSILCVFLDSPQKLLSRENLIDNYRGHHLVTKRVVDVAILRLRLKIDNDLTKPNLIKTKRGVGYKFDCDVTKILAKE